jgi:hypothetical protein
VAATFSRSPVAAAPGAPAPGVDVPVHAPSGRLAAASPPRFAALASPPDRDLAPQTETLRALQRLDDEARAGAAVVAGLSDEEVALATAVYRRADARRAVIEAKEAEAVADQAAPSARARSSQYRLWSHEGRLLREMEDALGGPRAQALRAAEAALYLQLLQEAREHPREHPGRPLPTDVIARRRQSGLRFLSGAIEDRQQPVDQPPPPPPS